MIGLEGSARFLGAWSFDYKGDLGVLFGTQNEFERNIGMTTTTPRRSWAVELLHAISANGGFANAGSEAHALSPC